MQQVLRSLQWHSWSGRLPSPPLHPNGREVSVPPSTTHGEITPVIPLKCKTLSIYFTFTGHHQYAGLAWQMWRESLIPSTASCLPGGQGGEGGGKKGETRERKKRGRGGGREGVEEKKKWENGSGAKAQYLSRQWGACTTSLALLSVQVAPASKLDKEPSRIWKWNS